MNAESIKNIVFDFGGVICDLDSERCLGEFRKLGLSGDIFPQQYSQFEGIFQEIDRGIMSVEEFYGALRRRSSTPDITDQQIHDAWVSLIVPIQQERFEALRQLKEHFDLFILSNSNEIHWEYIKQHRMAYRGEDATRWFKHIFLSHVLHLEKPESEIFRAVLDTAQIKASETLFVDDSQPNLDGAAKLGFHTMLSKRGDWMSRIILQNH